MAAVPADGHRDEQALRALAGWAEHDALRALHAVDRDVIRATAACRSLVLDHFAKAAPARDLFNACARLGGLMAEAGASPSLAAGAIDSAVHALGEAGVPFDTSRVVAARASLFEGYVAAVRDGERTSSLAAWEWPACAVPIGGGFVAIACGLPTDDGEALAAWAARVAGKLVRAKVRRVILSGPEVARAELASAAEIVGIEIVTQVPSEPHAAAPETKSWLRLPWRK
jgi:hypothetical protein